MQKLLAIIGLGALILAPNAQSDHNKVALPDNYQTTFTNYLSLDRINNPDQIMRIFANDIAMQGPGEDGKLPYGSIIVAEVYKAKKDADGNPIKSALLNRLLRGEKALIGVMQREKGWGEEYAEGLKNGNWEFAAYKADGSVADKDLDQCRACHAPLTDTNHLFSYEHLTK